MSDNNETDDISSREFNKISQDMSTKMVDRICNDIAADASDSSDDPLSKVLRENLAKKITGIIETNEGKQKLTTTVFDSIRLSLNTSRKNSILLYSLIKDPKLNSKLRLFIRSLFERVYKNNKKITPFSNGLLKILRDPPYDLFDLNKKVGDKKVGGKNKTRGRKNKYKKRTTRSLRKKQRGGVDPSGMDNPSVTDNPSGSGMIISQDCSKCPENKELDDLINSYKGKLIAAMDKNIEIDKHEIMERLLNAVRLYTLKNGNHILKSIIGVIGKTIIPSNISANGTNIIFLQSLYAASNEVNLAIRNTYKFFKDNKDNKDKETKFDPVETKFIDKFMEILKNSIAEHYA
jgi:hypothetical protein